MSKLDLALARFTKSLDSLEASLFHQTRLRAPEEYADDLVHLRQERLRISKELEHARTEASELEDVTSEIALRLDEAILDIKQVLTS